ncbi:NitT/TauT family transport system ATP-binding protein [Propionispira arboris]|uniref:NitT/TauT family transport system ATP-binding protein n=1 Tax=Propionispira arboris TaxID=84035 RepID=A0A1H6YR52_9FIRM|nr:nitrate/sulfonate/bicarbonate ABC transporter ATP-binding protein [Propionispira arboris]SEJ43788.1 NitT/TauT family transport system ATP-binding protein [Propionispira arboris]
MKNLVEIKNVNKTFAIEGRSAASILENISINIQEGEFLAILGPSGSGKSTLLRIIAGLIPASSGTVSYLGSPIEGVNPGVAMVFQSFALFPWLSVLENVMLGLEDKNLTKAEKQAKALQVIDIVGLDGFENAYPKELSGGMRQRVGIGRALVSEPDVLLMDEAFSALDVLTAENLRRDLLELWLDKKIPTKAIILVTHGIEEAVYMADRAIILSKSPAEIVKDVKITIPRWRDKKSPEFLSIVDEIYSFMTKKKITALPPALPQLKKLTQLPQVSAGALTGFLELLEDLNEKTDLYKLASRFMMDIEDFFPLVELSTLLQFAQVVEGDIELTAEGIQFARATVLERKKLFSEQLLAHVPFVQQMITILESKSNKKMNIEFFEDLLARTFGDKTAQSQMALLISWERYAELVEYDQNKEQVYLESTV